MLPDDDGKTQKRIPKEKSTDDVRLRNGNELNLKW